MPDAPQPDWRQSGSDATSSGPAKPWQADETTSSGPSAVPSKRNIRRTVAVLSVLLLAVGIGVVAYWLRAIKPSCLILVGSGYEQNLLLPHNAHGWNGLHLLEREVTQASSFKDGFRFPWDQPTKIRQAGLDEMKEQGWKDIWKKIRARIDEGPRKENTVLLFVSLHGMADDKEAYLAPNVSGLRSGQSFEQACIPFREVLESLQTVKHKKIVLLLDVAQAPLHTPIGMLHNDFVARLKQEYGKKIDEMSNLVVICSADADQRSWASEEWQNSVFAHYVTQALKGDEHTPGANVTAGSLYDYLKKKVDTWAQTNRARKQTPILLGGQARADGMALVHIAEPYAPPPAPSASLDVDVLKAEWDKWQKLRNEHAPHVHNPHLWRLYQDTLLRYEQLARVGAAKAADDVKASLVKLHDDIAKTRALTGAFPSLGNSFPMAGVLGYSPPVHDSVLQDFLTSLRKLDDDEKRDLEKPKVLSPIRDNRSIQDKQFIATRLSHLILKDARGKANRERERDRLAEIETALAASRRSAEAQLFKMLQDADRDLDEVTIQLALSVRVLAEETALSTRRGSEAIAPIEPYAEVIFPWILKDVDAADKLRRDGEDLLFGNPKEHALKARGKLQDAQALYEKARATSQKLQIALALRDEASADLPYLAAWAASAPALSDPHRKEIEAVRESAEKLGVGLAALNRALDAESREATPSPDLVASIAANLKVIRESLRTTSEKLRTVAAQQRNWHAVDAALAVPPTGTRDEDILLRKNLLRKLHDISGELLGNKNPEGKVEEEEPLEKRVKTRRELLHATLKSFDELAAQGTGNVSDKVRDYFVKLPAEISAKSDPLADTQELVIAANMCRAIPGAFADQVRDETKKRINPVDRLRRTRLHALLHWMAERTLADHWFGPDPGKDGPYYDRAGKDYLLSARGLFEDEPIPDALVKNAERVRKKFALTQLRLGKLDGKLQFTTETDLTVPYKVQADQDLPVGTPMIWLEVSDGKVTEKVWPRLAMSTWPKFEGAFPLDHSSFSSDSVVTVNLHAYYRGQHLRESSPSMRSQPNVIVRQGPGLNENTSLAVRMDSKFDYGAISIVLDNSGSMKFRHPKKGDKDDYANRKEERRRFDFALDALEHVLRKVPDNTHLSFFTLGDKGGTKVGRFPVATPWQQEKLAALRSSLEEIPADIGSPIAEAIIKSMDEGFPATGFKGPKVVLVLTDGDDNGSFRDEVGDRSQRLVNELKAAHAKHPDIAVVVVCFIDKNADEKSAAEYKSAKGQFGVVEQFKLRGHFLDVPDADKLGTTIEDLLRPRLQLLRLDEQDPVAGFQTGHPINYHNDRALDWKKMAPGEFNAHVLRTSANPLVNVKILPGQKIFMVLNRTDEKLSLKRGLLAYQPETELRGEWRKEKAGWTVSLLENENKNLNPNTLKQLLAFEQQETEKDRIRQPVPGLTWLELDAVTGVRPDKTLRWWKDGNVPAPALRLEMREWLPNSQPKVTAWFWPEEREAFLANRNLVARAARPVPHRHKTEAEPAELPVIEYVDWKEREIEISAGNKVKRDCLVVRVRHAKGKPVWVDLEQRAAGIGSEHHFFFGADSCTSYFYGFARPENANLILVDLPAFKAAAQRVEFSPDVSIKAPRLLVPESP